MRGAAQEKHEQLVELVAEGKDALMEEYFEKGTIPEEDLVPALHEAIREDRIFPVLYASGLGNIGVDELMDFIVDSRLRRTDREPMQGEVTAGNGEPPTRQVADAGPLSLYVFKTVSNLVLGAVFRISKFSRAC